MCLDKLLGYLGGLLNGNIENRHELRCSNDFLPAEMNVHRSLLLIYIASLVPSLT